ncbi:MAG: phosphatase PAP2 family protein [Nanoarchaeota archaeon]
MLEKYKLSKKAIFIAVISIIILSLFLDKAAFAFVSFIKNPLFDAAFLLITNPLSIFIVLAFSSYVIFFDRKKRKWLYFLLASLTLSVLLSFILKLIIARPRPSEEMFYLFFNLADYSFPSMHALAAFAMLPLLNKILPRLKLLWISFASLFALSRVYLGIHFFSDIIAGAFFGYFIGIFMVYLENKISVMGHAEFKSMLEEFEFRRKAFHAFLGITLVLLIKFGIIGWMELIFLAISVIIFSMLSKKYRIPLIYQILKILEREKHLKGFVAKGLLFYLIGAFLVVFLFPKEIALASIMVLAFGDSISHLFGVKFGRINHPFNDKKFLEGMIAGTIAGFFAALFFVRWHEALIASLLAMFAEGLELKVGAEEVDDNLVIPLVAAISIWIIRLF